ncbi:MAG TPA: hypothetical protein VJ782_02180 [Aeromicrobium sp.]|nr:hypothetical protein [Aeromicrobium sp.]
MTTTETLTTLVIIALALTALLWLLICVGAEDRKTIRWQRTTIAQQKAKLEEAQRQADNDAATIKGLFKLLVRKHTGIEDAPVPYMPTEQEVMADVLRFRPQINALDGGEGA